MSRSIWRRALLAAALPAAVAAFALPSAAHAGVVGTGAEGELFYTDTSGAFNDVTVRMRGDKIVISDPARITSGTSACQVFNLVEAVCPGTASSVTISTFAGNDTVRYRLPHAGFVDLGSDSDQVFAGTREAAGRSIQPVTYRGGFGHDLISYREAGRGVTVDMAGAPAEDGPPGDREQLGIDFEVLDGSSFDDVLFGSANPDIMSGGGGRDQLAGGAGDDLFRSPSPDGADDYHGGPDRDAIDYFGRNQPLVVELNNVDDDGERDERDNVRSNVENLHGGSAGDVLRSLGAFSRLEGRGGDDFLFGDAGPDTLIGGSGVDNLNAGGDNDIVDSRDGRLDTIDCGDAIDSDTLVKDSQERRVNGCESVQIGTLRLVPKHVRTEVGETARVRLSWRHPRAWRKLRTIELRLTRDKMPVGEITIRPRGERITDGGAVTLVRRGTRLMRRGKTIAARLALRLDQSLAGQTLEAEVETTDRRGRRQLERDAGRIRVRG